MCKLLRKVRDVISTNHSLHSDMVEKRSCKKGLARQGPFSNQSKRCKSINTYPILFSSWTPPSPPPSAFSSSASSSTCSNCSDHRRCTSVSGRMSSGVYQLFLWVIANKWSCWSKASKSATKPTTTISASLLVLCT